MLPGKVYRPEDVVLILRRRIWFLLVPFAIVAAATAVASRRLPDLYRSDTLILVVPQRVPESYVKSTVTSRIEDRLQSISQQILSRTRLERIIQDFNLYATERKTGIMEDIVEHMRADIKVDVVKGDAFRVSYVGRDPRTVMKVTERLSSLFIEENLRDREVLAEGTDQFLEAQLEDTRRRLAEHETKLLAYRKQFAGQLPSQLEANLATIQGTSSQLQQLNESLNRDRDRHLVVERQLNDLMAAGTSPPSMTDPSDSNGGSAAQQLAAANAALAAMQLKLKADHPDIRRAKRVVAELEKKAEQEALQAPLSPEAAPRKATPAEIARVNKITDLRAELDQLNRQIAFKQNEDKRLRSVVGSYQQRVEAAPTRESEMSALTRDYATLQTLYQNLLGKKEESKIAANLERRQIGEQFKLLDPARMPEKPFSPNRQMINLLGLCGGIAIGAVLIGFLEYRDASFRTDDEITAVLKVPVLAVVPLMRSEPERKKMMRRRIALGFGLSATVAACLAVVVYTFVR
jgi:polysaccharide chain length determinant protein (PEP-CTERM system associated)